MTDRNFGQESNQWWGIIENVNDPEKEGRYQVRIHGMYDDTVNIPDKDLPWAKTTMDATSAGHNKVGYLPVGLIKGGTVGGHWADFDKQYPVITHTIAKAGDTQEGNTVNGQTQLKKGTNSNPISERNKNNKFITRKGRNIKQEDNLPPQQYAPESNDSEGRDVAGEEVAKTKFSQIPTVASLVNPVGSILQQITKVDPSYLTSVLPNAVTAFTKLKDLNTFSATNNVTNVLGQGLGSVFNQAFQALGASTVLNSLASAIIPSQLTSMAQQALATALITANNPPPVSDTVNNVIESIVGPLYNQLIGLVTSGQLTTDAFNSIIESFFNQVQSLGSQATLGSGVTPSNILNVLGQVLPTIAGQIEGTLQGHLPISVLNNGTVTDAIKKFAMNQAFLKAPTEGKKALAILATQQGASAINTQVQSAISGVQGLTTNTLQTLGHLF